MCADWRNEGLHQNFISSLYITIASLNRPKYQINEHILVCAALIDLFESVAAPSAQRRTQLTHVASSF